MDKPDTPCLSVFLSSSSDVIAERRMVTGLVAELAQRHQRYVDIQLVDWQADFYSADADFQAQIPNAANSDLVVCIFHRRVGSELDPAKYTRPDGSRYEGGAVYEFECAFESRARSGTPDLYVFRKTADVVYTEGPDLDEQRRQYQMLQQFLQRWSQDEEGHLTSAWNSFEDVADFRGQFKAFFKRWFDDWAEAHDIKLLDWDSHPEADGSPFVGLAPFTERHRRVFFGRESEMHRAVELLSQAAVRADGVSSLLILGASGAGKSSFMHAALLPQLLTPGLTEGVDHWLRADLRLDPQEPQPLLRLAEQLFAAQLANDSAAEHTHAAPLAGVFSKSVFDSPAKLADQLQDRPEHAGELLDKALLDVGEDLASRIPELDSLRVQLLLSVDQLEALVGQGAGESAHACMQVLESLARCRRVWLVAAARNDHYAQLQRAEPIRRLLVQGARLDLLHPDSSQLREMVEGPVRAAGLRYEQTTDDSLNERLIADVAGTDALPLLQVALSELFDTLQQRRAEHGFDADNSLRLADYRALSQDAALPGLLGAIDRHAESCWQQYKQRTGHAGAEADLRALLRKLALPSAVDEDTSSRPTRQELFARTPERASLVAAFVASRLLVSYERDGQNWLRPSHDSLLRHWQRARTQIAADREHLQWRESMRGLAQHWFAASPADKAQHLSLAPATLAGALSLQQAFGSELQDEPIAPNSTTQADASLGDFLQAVALQDKRLRARQQRRVWLAAAVLAAVAVSMAVLWQRAEGQRQVAESERQRAQNNLRLARQTADSLVTDLAFGFEDAVGISTGTINKILGKAEELHTRLEAGNQISGDFKHGKIWRLFAQGDTLRAQGGLPEAMLKYQEAKTLSKQLVELDPQNSEWKRDLSLSIERVGDVLVAQGDRAGALKAYRDSQAIRQELNELDPQNSAWKRDLWVSFIKVGGVLVAQGDRAGALKAYRDGLKIAQELNELDPQNSEWKRDLSVSLNNVGDVLIAQGDRAGALKAFRDGQEIFKELSELDPQNSEWKRDLSASFIKVGDVLVAQGNRAGALKAFRDSREIFKELSELDPQNSEWKRDLSVSFGLVGNVLVAQGDRVGALKAYRDSQAIRQELSELDPQNSEWKRDLSASFIKVGGVLVAQGDRAGALKAFRDGLKIAQELNELDPQNSEWKRDLSVSLNNVGDVLIAQGDRAGALKAYRDGLKIAQELSELDPQNSEWKRDLSVSFGLVGNVLVAQGDRVGALKAYRDGLKIAQELSELDPQNSEWKRDLSVSLNNVGDVLIAQGDRAGALKAFRDGQEIFKELSELDPQNSEWKRDLSASFIKVGGVLVAQGDRAGALKAYRDGLKIAQELSELDPQNSEWKRDLSLSIERVGDVLVAQGDRVGALKAYCDSQAIRQELSELDPQNSAWKRDLWVSFIKVGGVLVAQGDRAGALKAYRDGLKIAQELNELDPQNSEWKRDLSVSYDRVGDVLVAQGDRVGALKAYRDSQAIRQELSELDPQNSAWKRDLWVSFIKVGGVLVAQGDRAGALKAFRDGLKIAQELNELDPQNSEWKRDLSVSLNNVGDVLIAQGDRAGALKAFRDGLKIAQELNELDPQNSEWKRDIAVSDWNLAIFHERDENWPNAIEHWQAAVDTLRAMKKVGILAPVDEQYIPMAEKRLRAARQKAEPQ